jgi:hypothetical protein
MGIEKTSNRKTQSSNALRAGKLLRSGDDRSEDLLDLNNFFNERRKSGG